MPTTRGKRKRQSTLDGQIISPDDEEDGGQRQASSTRSTRASSRKQQKQEQKPVKVKLNLPPPEDDINNDPEYDADLYSDYEDALLPEDDDEPEEDEELEDDNADEERHSRSSYGGQGSRGSKNRSRGKSKSKKSKKSKSDKKYYISEGIPYSDCEPEDDIWGDAEEDEKDAEMPSQPSDHPTVATIVLFQVQFMDFFEGVPPIGPQDVEQAMMNPDGISGSVELFLCRTLSLMLNRKKPVEPGKYHRALEEVHSQLSTLGISPYWPEKLKLKSGKDALNVLEWQDRLEFFRMLVIWTLSSSNAIHQALNNNEATGTITDSFLPVGYDGDWNRYYLVHGAGDTPFRLYRGTNPYVKSCNWNSVAGTITELEKFINDLYEEDGSSAAIDLYHLLKEQVEVLRESEIRRQKEEQRLLKKKQMQEQADAVRSGQGMYTGRTRGKRVNYNVDNLAANNSLEDDDQDGEQDGRGEKEEDFDPDEMNNDDDEMVMERGGSRRRSARLRGVEATQVTLDDLEKIEEEQSMMVKFTYSPEKLHALQQQQQAYYQQYYNRTQPQYPSIPPQSQQFQQQQQWYSGQQQQQSQWPSQYQYSHHTSAPQQHQYPVSAHQMYYSQHQPAAAYSYANQYYHQPQLQHQSYQHAYHQSNYGPSQPQTYSQYQQAQAQGSNNMTHSQSQPQAFHNQIVPPKPDVYQQRAEPQQPLHNQPVRMEQPQPRPQPAPIDEYKQPQQQSGTLYTQAAKTEEYQQPHSQSGSINNQSVRVEEPQPKPQPPIEEYRQSQPQPGPLHSQAAKTEEYQQPHSQSDSINSQPVKVDQTSQKPEVNNETTQSKTEASIQQPQREQTPPLDQPQPQSTSISPSGRGFKVSDIIDSTPETANGDDSSRTKPAETNGN